MRVAVDHVVGAAAGDAHHLRSSEAALEQSARRLVAQIVEAQVAYVELRQQAAPHVRDGPDREQGDIGTRHVLQRQAVARDAQGFSHDALDFLRHRNDAGSLRAFGAAFEQDRELAGVTNYQEFTLSSRLGWNPVKNFGIGAEVMWQHGVTSRPVGLAFDVALVANGLPAFKSWADLVRGRVRMYRAFKSPKRSERREPRRESAGVFSFPEPILRVCRLMTSSAARGCRLPQANRANARSSPWPQRRAPAPRRRPRNKGHALAFPHPKGRLK